MPHRVTNFLRTSSGGIPHIIAKPPGGRSPYASDSDDSQAAGGVSEVGDLKKKNQHNHHHRLSLPFARALRDHSSSSGPVALDWKIESPPIVFHGSAEESSGALVSGQMFLDVRSDAPVDVESFSAALSVRVNHKRPFQGHCSACQRQDTEIKAWRFLALPTTLRRGRHQYPFSVLLEGHLPATADTSLLSIAYEFRAEALLVRNNAAGPSAGKTLMPVRFERPVVVRRSLPEADFPHNSVRVFPPTNIKASAQYMAVIHPTSENRVTLKLDGLMSRNAEGSMVDLWKLKKVTWRVEETARTVAPACERHMPADADADGNAGADRRGILRSESRIVGEKMLHEGWKSDYSGGDGIVDFEFDYRIDRRRTSGRDPKYACDSRSRDGTQVTHSLLLELVVSKEYAPGGRPELSAPSGTGRILRMHYAVVATDHPGMGVSWDNEAPPVYQDVPPSPPGYPTQEPPIEYEDLQPLDAQRSSVERDESPLPGRTERMDSMR